MDAPRPIGVLGTAPPLLSIFLPDCNIHVTTNTFVRFMEGETECLGMVIGIKVAERAFTVRRFFSSQQLRLIVDNSRNDISFWPRLGQSESPSYVCDSDIIDEVGHAAAKGKRPCLCFLRVGSLGKASTGHGKCVCCVLFFEH